MGSVLPSVIVPVTLNSIVRGPDLQVPVPDDPLAELIASRSVQWPGLVSSKSESTVVVGPLGVGVGLGMGVKDGVAVALRAAVGVDVLVPNGVGVAVVVGVGIGVGVEVGDGVGATAPDSYAPISHSVAPGAGRP